MPTGRLWSVRVPMIVVMSDTCFWKPLCKKSQCLFPVDSRPVFSNLWSADYWWSVAVLQVVCGKWLKNDKIENITFINKLFWPNAIHCSEP